MQELRRYGYGTVAHVIEVRGTLKLEKQKSGVESVFMNEVKDGTSVGGAFNTLCDSKSIQHLRRISVVCEGTEDAKRLISRSPQVRKPRRFECRLCSLLLPPPESAVISLSFVGSEDV